VWGIIAAGEKYNGRRGKKKKIVSNLDKIAAF